MRLIYGFRAEIGWLSAALHICFSEIAQCQFYLRCLQEGHGGHGQTPILTMDVFDGHQTANCFGNFSVKDQYKNSCHLHCIATTTGHVEMKVPSKWVHLAQYCIVSWLKVATLRNMFTCGTKPINPNGIVFWVDVHRIAVLEMGFSQDSLQIQMIRF